MITNHRRFKVGYALADGNTYDTPRLPFFSFIVAEKYANWWRAYLTRHYATFAVFVTDMDDEERGNVYGTDIYNEGR